MSILNNSLLLGADAGAAGYQVSRSIRLNASDSAFLSRTPASAGNRKTWTWSGWVKRSALGGTQVFFGSWTDSSNTMGLMFNTSNQLFWDSYLSGSLQGSQTTSAVFRDTSAWYHIVWAVDTTNATAANRSRIYVNGTEVAYAGATNPSQNADLIVNRAASHTIGNTSASAGNYFSGYLADIHFIDGQALTPSSFAETNATTGQWVPKAYTGSYGTNGFRLDFSDNSAATATTLGKDRAGSNNWTPNNLSVTAGAGNDSLVDTPTSYGTDAGAGGEVRGNYATANPLDKGANVTLTNGNLDVSTASTWNSVRATFGLTSGKWYWEYTMTAAGYTMIGIGTRVIDLAGYIGQSSAGYAFYSLTGNKWNAGSAASYGSSFTTNDVIGVAFDADAGKIWFAKNGTWQASGDPTAGTNAAYSSIPSGVYFPTISQDNSLPAATGGSLNAGARPFAYTAPSGFKALCDTNLPAPVVAKPNTVMDVATWSGDSAASRSITFSQSISPDLVWVKCRSNSAYHGIYDSVRGVNRVIFPNDTLAEINTPGNGYVSAFNSNGFTLTAGSLSSDDTNQSGRTYVAWAWDAGSSTVTNTQGSITSTVRANASAGFSIAGFSFPSSGPSSFGHGLNVAPSLVIIKSRSNGSQSWIVGHSSIGWTNYLLLNTTGASSANSTVWNNTAPSSTVVTLGSGFTSGNYGADGIAYCFAPVAGYSAFGSYTGNGSADGPAVWLGFRPRWILLKNISDGYDGGGSIVNSHSWVIYDAARSSYNAAGDILAPNKSFAEENNLTAIDILSSGFKLRTNRSAMNPGSTQTMIYAAFAESPFQYARAR